jgi:hypothetical protein
MRLLLVRLFPKILASTDRLQDSPTRHRGAVTADDEDLSMKIVNSRGFQMMFSTKRDGKGAGVRELADDTDDSRRTSNRTP